MILISHRGNVDGKNPHLENHPDYINEALELGYDVEIDLWLNDGVLYLGHDVIQYEINYQWLKQRKNKLWIHCKNIEALEWCDDKVEFHYFWHQEETTKLTSQGTIWEYPGKQPIKNSIAVMPELHGDNITYCLGICSDFVGKYNKITNV
jgi:hypothetical protein